MSTDIKSVLQQQVEKWPLEDQKELGQAAIAIEAQRRGVDPGALEQFARKLTIAVATQELEEPTKYWRDWKDNYLYNAKRWALGFLIPLLTTVLAIVLLLIFQPQFLEISRDNEKVAIAQAIQHVLYLVRLLQQYSGACAKCFVCGLTTTTCVRTPLKEKLYSRRLLY